MEWETEILGAALCLATMAGLALALKFSSWRSYGQVRPEPVFCQGMDRARGTVHGRRHHMNAARWSPGDEADLVDGLAAFLERDLRLTEEQRPAWQQLTQIAKATMAEAAGLRGGPGARPSDALLQLEEMRQLFTTGLGAIDRIEPAFREFYRLLDDAQQARVDAAFHHGRQW